MRNPIRHSALVALVLAVTAPGLAAEKPSSTVRGTQLEASKTGLRVQGNRAALRGMRSRAKAASQILEVRAVEQALDVTTLLPAFDRDELDPTEGRSRRGEDDRFDRMLRGRPDQDRDERLGFDLPKGYEQLKDPAMPSNLGKGPRRVLGPPSASLRDHASGLAGQDSHWQRRPRETAESRRHGGIARWYGGGNGWTGGVTQSPNSVRHDRQVRFRDGTMRSELQVTESGPGGVTRDVLIEKGPNGQVVKTDLSPDALTGTQTQETLGGRDRICHPLTGQCRRKKRVNPTHVNPGTPEEVIAERPRVEVERGALVSNPDPNRPFRGGFAPRRFESQDRVNPLGPND